MKSTKPLPWILVCLLSLVWSQTPAPDQVCLVVPPDVEECYRSFQGKPISATAAQIVCLQKLLWNFTPEENLTAHDVDYLKHLIGYTGPDGGVFKPATPPSGHRVRKEYRTLSDAERQRFHDALTKMYQDGILRMFARLNARAAASHYGGPSFLLWHRVFLALFEEALRQYDPIVSLPFWDSTIDDDMDNPVNSVLWSSTYFGNGAGSVIEGPYAQWVTEQGYLERQYGRQSRLLSLEMIRDVLSRCKLEDISSPGASPKSNLEFLQSGVNLWVGGDMSSPITAGFDPVFYMHLAFVDYVWELYRRHQFSACGLDPSIDYPDIPVNNSHSLTAPMEGFDWMTNQEGLEQYWTGSWYQYESTPTCPNCCPNCSTPAPVYCESRNLVCLAQSRRKFPFDLRTATSSMLIETERYLDPSEIASIERTSPSRNRVVTVVGPPNDGRTLYTAVVDTILANSEDPSTTDRRSMDPRARGRRRDGSGDVAGPGATGFPGDVSMSGLPEPGQATAGTRTGINPLPDVNPALLGPPDAIPTGPSIDHSPDRLGPSGDGFSQGVDSMRWGDEIQRGGRRRDRGMSQGTDSIRPRGSGGSSRDGLDSTRQDRRMDTRRQRGSFTGPRRDDMVETAADIGQMRGSRQGRGSTRQRSGGFRQGGGGQRQMRDGFGQGREEIGSDRQDSRQGGGGQGQTEGGFRRGGGGSGQMRDSFDQTRGGAGQARGGFGQGRSGASQQRPGFDQRSDGRTSTRGVRPGGQWATVRPMGPRPQADGVTRGQGPGPGVRRADGRRGVDPRTGMDMLRRDTRMPSQESMGQGSGFQTGQREFVRRPDTPRPNIGVPGQRRDFGQGPSRGFTRRQDFDRSMFDPRQSVGSRQ